jgi:hypothetical protein
MKKRSAILKSAFIWGVIPRVCFMNGHVWERLCELGYFSTQTMVASVTADLSHRPPFSRNADLDQMTVWQQFVAVSIMNWTLAWIMDETDNPAATQTLRNNMAWFLQHRVNRDIKMFLRSDYIGDDNVVSVDIIFPGKTVKFCGPKIGRSHQARRDELIQQFLPHMADDSFQRWIGHLELAGMDALISPSTVEQVSQERPRKRRKVGGA